MQPLSSVPYLLPEKGPRARGFCICANFDCVYIHHNYRALTNAMPSCGWNILLTAETKGLVRTCAALGAAGMEWPGPKMHPKAIMTSVRTKK